MSNPIKQQRTMKSKPNTYVLTLSKTFPATHPRKGEPPTLGRMD